MKKLLKGSPADRGTLTYIKNRYNHRNAGTNVMGCFHHAENLVSFATKASIISMVCNILGVDKLLNLPKMSQQRLHQLSHDVVDRIWSGPTRATISEILDVFPDGHNWDSDWCICGEGM